MTIRTEYDDAPSGQMVRVPQAGEMVVNGFGSSAVERRGETSSTALAEQAKAAVQARYIVAMQRPRSMSLAREKLLKDCMRPGFATKAIYRKPIGKGVEGPSIRLAEAASRAMGNIVTDVFSIFDDEQRRIVRVMASDLEANLTYTKDVTVRKVVERNQVRQGQNIVAQRIGSTGKVVYVVEASDDEILDRENALTSKAMRTCLLRLVPGDLIDEAMDQCYATMRSDAAKDPEATRKAVADGFLRLGVGVAQLSEYLGHAVDLMTPDEAVSLRTIYATIRDGEATWAQVMERRRAETDVVGSPAPAQATQGQTPSPGQAQQPPAGKKNLTDLANASKAKREAAKTPSRPTSVADEEGDDLPEGFGDRVVGEDDE